MLYRITFKNQFKALDFIIFIAAFLVAFLTYLKFDPNAIFIATIIFLIQFIPVLYLHIEYLTINGASTLKMDTVSKTISYVHKGNETLDLALIQIEKVILYLPPSAYRGPIERKIQFLPIEPYGYAVIYSREGDKIIVTSLMVPDILVEFEKIEGLKLDKKKRIFASPSFYKMIQWFMKDGL